MSSQRQNSFAITIKFKKSMCVKRFAWFITGENSKYNAFSRTNIRSSFIVNKFRIYWMATQLSSNKLPEKRNARLIDPCFKINIVYIQIYTHVYTHVAAHVRIERTRRHSLTQRYSLQMKNFQQNIPRVFFFFLSKSKL